MPGAEGNASDLIKAHDRYVQFGRGAQPSREAYRALFRNALDAAIVNDIRTATNGGFVLGAARYRDKIAAKLGRRVTSGQPGRPSRKAIDRDSVKPRIRQHRPIRDSGRLRKSH